MTACRYISADTGLHVRLMEDDSVQNNRVITSELIAAGGNDKCNVSHVYPKRTRFENYAFTCNKFHEVLGS